MCLIDKVLDLDKIELIDQVDGNGVQCFQQKKLSYVIWKDASQKKVLFQPVFQSFRVFYPAILISFFLIC